jgi:hypothetical protein
LLRQDLGAGRWAKPRLKAGERLIDRWRTAIDITGPVIDIKGRIARCTTPIRHQTPHFGRYVSTVWASLIGGGQPSTSRGGSPGVRHYPPSNAAFRALRIDCLGQHIVVWPQAWQAGQGGFSANSGTWPRRTFSRASDRLERLDRDRRCACP